VSVLPPAPQIPQNVLSPLQQIALRSGLTLEDLMRASEPEPTQSKHDSVPHGPEMRRILALPSRPNPADSKASEQLATFLTEKLARTSSPYPGKLRPLQAAALQDIWLNKLGAFLPVPVGFGKTLICYLSATILNSPRPLYIAPAGLLKQARTEFLKYYKHWHGVHPDAWTFLSYEVLSREGAGVQVDENRKVLRAALLDRLDPSHVTCDEIHKMRAKSTSVARKFRDFKRSHPNTPLLGLTGTPGNEVIHVAHLMQWCLGKDNSPYPNDFQELMAWQAATASKASFGPPTDIGALRTLFTNAEMEKASTASEDELKALARCAIGRRARETRGVVGVEGGELDIPLSIEAVEPTTLDPKIDEALLQIRTLGMTPDGDVIPDATVMAAKTAMIGRGYWTKFADPKPPAYWMEARRAKNSWVRDVIQHNRIGLYSEEAVKKAVQKKVLNDFGLYEHWEAAQARYKAETGLDDPITEEVLISNEPVNFAVRWVEQNPDSIVWAWHREFGQRLAKAIGTSCYQEEGLDANGRYVADHPHGTPMVCSYPANSVGKDLQHGWSKNLWFHAPNEQALGRTHRPGQKKAVHNAVYVATREHAASFWTQMGKAQEAFEMNGSAQRLLYAVNSVPPLEEFEMRKGVRWVK
jgi:hypothetical protein